MVPRNHNVAVQKASFKWPKENIMINLINQKLSESVYLNCNYTIWGDCPLKIFKLVSINYSRAFFQYLFPHNSFSHTSVTW